MATRSGWMTEGSTRPAKEKDRRALDKKKITQNAVAGDRTRVARVTGGNTHHYTTTTVRFYFFRVFT